MRSTPGPADRLHDLTRRFRTGDQWREAERRAFLQQARDEGLELEASNLLVDDILSGECGEDSVRRILTSRSLLRALAVLQMRDRGRFEATLDTLRTTRGARLVAGLEKSVNSERRALERERRKERKESHRAHRCEAVDARLGAPVPPGTVLPLGYTVTHAGVIAERTYADGEVHQQLLAPSPILISRRLKDVDDHTEKIELTWRRDGEWQRYVVPRGEVASSPDSIAR